jgi:hypothetical protein
VRIFATALLLASLWFLYTGFKGRVERRAERLPASATSELITDRIVKSGHRDLEAEAFAARSAGLNMSSKMTEVVYTCLDHYNRESCLHHLIKCGMACRTLIPNEKFAEIESDYWSVMRERGLWKPY